MSKLTDRRTSIEIKDIQIKTTQVLLEQANLTVDAGEKIILTGPSGCGKTTMLLTLIGGFKCQSGSIKVNGLLLNAQNIQKIRSLISYIPQAAPQRADKVIDTLMEPFLYQCNRSKTPKLEKIKKLFEQLKLQDKLLDQSVQRLSGGQKQRLLIIIAILLERPIILADEPTSALDEQSKQAVIDLLMQDKYTMLSVSHDHDWIERQQYIYQIKDKRIDKTSNGFHVSNKALT
ncbi:MAG: ATP-binding cassette domain-containing protein [Methylococcales bacterium]